LEDEDLLSADLATIDQKPKLVVAVAHRGAQVTPAIP
jgi:hypothetical protein